MPPLFLSKKVDECLQADTPAYINNGLELDSMQLQEAKAYLNHTLPDAEKYIEADDLTTAQRLSYIGLQLYIRGELSAVTFYLERALMIYHKQVGVNHLYNAIGLNNLGMLLEAQGKVLGARMCLARAAAVLTEQMPDHPYTTIVRNSLARIDPHPPKTNAYLHSTMT